MWLNKTILMPTDFTEPSHTAANAAIELAQRFHVPLVLAYVYTTPASIYTGVPFVPVDKYIRQLEDSARSALDKEAQRLRGKGVEITTALRMGIPWEQILDLAQTLDAGLIVMGTHGRRGLPRALLGSVAEKVVRLSPVPVLTLHPRADE